MGKKIKIYERFLLGLSFSADVLYELYMAGSTSSGRRHFFSSWSPPGYKKQSFYNTYSRLLRTGYIEKIVKNGRPVLRLTSKANQKIKRDFPLLKMQKKKWDGKWRVVIFDIGEKLRYERDLLRNKLKDLGFGMLQRSVYISPHSFERDIAEFLDAKKLFGKALVLVAPHKLMGDPKDFARIVWNIKELEKNYNLLLKRILESEDKMKKNEIRKIKERYLQIVIKDPCLPYDLLPDDWVGREVRMKVVKLYKKI